jgi:3-deoxy-manno-octulosonate cytidylyltransferase (CMP-KDO synthetase)
MKDICICIPARLHSTRLDEKLLYKFGDKTAIELTLENVLKCDIPIYLLTDDIKIKNICQKYPVNIILTNEKCKNGTERIVKYLNLIDKKYKYIVNIQADEPFINYKNINYCIKKHKDNLDDKSIFYTTLHQEYKNENLEYIKSTACVKVVINNKNDVLYYSRSVIPNNKDNKINTNIVYKTFTGIYVFNRKLLEKYNEYEDTELQKEEDIEQLKILEIGYKIKSYATVEYNEISLNTLDDYNYLLLKYN